MGLGPPVCKTCMKLMTGCHEGRWWGCDDCGIDDLSENATNLFSMTKNEVDIVLKDEPELRASLKKIFNK